MDLRPGALHRMQQLQRWDLAVLYGRRDLHGDGLDGLEHHKGRDLQLHGPGPCSLGRQRLRLRPSILAGGLSPVV